MTRQADLVQEDRTVRRNQAVIRALEFELVGSLEACGCTLLGFSVKIEDWECLITLRAVVGEERMVAFVGSDSLSNCLVKCVMSAQRDKLVWKEDKYR